MKTLVRGLTVLVVLVTLAVVTLVWSATKAEEAGRLGIGMTAAQVDKVMNGVPFAEKMQTSILGDSRERYYFAELKAVRFYGGRVIGFEQMGSSNDQAALTGQNPAREVASSGQRAQEVAPSGERAKAYATSADGKGGYVTREVDPTVSSMARVGGGGGVAGTAVPRATPDAMAAQRGWKSSSPLDQRARGR